MNDLSYLEEHTEDVEEDKLDRIVRLSEMYLELEIELKQAEEGAKQAKKRFNKCSMEQLPEALQSAGMESFKLEDGAEVSYKTELNASVKDYTLLESFLEERGDDALIKTSFNVAQIPKNIVNRIMKDFSDKYGIDADVNTTIHPQTLKAYLMRICGLKKGTVAEVPIGYINQEMVSTFVFYKSKIKPAKKVK